MSEDVIASRARALAGALVQSGFARLRVRDGETEIELRRAAAAAVPRAVGALPAAAGAAGAPGADGEGAEPARRPADIVASEVVGIVRLLRPALSEGQEVDADRDLGYVETLGIRNAVRARGPGRISAVLVTDGQPVEYGQPLFAIER
ncbi:MAG TPA: biotin/lipoyl-containing protein [Candidatus Baltobacteraceae bacterium]|nr:biotin/lipoyl-containing protein [Candidatus Baltobacteraceae bacterium]